MLIRRLTDENRLLQALPRVLLYGRRKTGKTTLAKSLGWAYYYVLPSGFVQHEHEHIPPASFRQRLITLLTQNTPFILDEIHRLPRDLISLFHAYPTGTYVLITSSMSALHRFQHEENPLLGIALPVRISLIHPVDLLPALAQTYPLKEAFERALYYQEPGIIPFLEGKPLHTILTTHELILHGLLTEAFSEERIKLNQRLYGILKAMSTGAWKPTELAHALHSMGLLETPQPNLLSPYLSLLTHLDLVQELPIWQKKRVYRRITSPYIHLLLATEDARTSSEEHLKHLLHHWTPRLIEPFFERLLLTFHPGTAVRILQPEVDIAIATSKHTLRLAGEVKWKKTLSRKECMHIHNLLTRVPAETRALISLTPCTHFPFTTYTLKDLLAQAQNHRELLLERNSQLRAAETRKNA